MILKIKNKIKRDGIFGLTIAIIKYPLHACRRILHRDILNLKSQKDIFSEKYEKNHWLVGESKSGNGSEISFTEPLRHWLIENIGLLGIKTFVDAPCGDFNWMRLVLSKVQINYIGLDIVDKVIEQNKILHSSNHIKFEVANICEDNLPDCDIIMVRDCLFHLSYEDINNFLINLSKTNYKYLLTTTHKVNQNFKNLNIETGAFRLIDLFSYPFFFDKRKVKARVEDFPKGFSIKREMILLEKDFVPKQLAKKTTNK